MVQEFEQLRDLLTKEYASSNPRLTVFPSGAAMLDVDIGSVWYVMAYFPSVGVGISNADKAVFGWEGFNHPFDNFQGAKNFLLSLLKNAPPV